VIAAACALIVGGALLASKELLFRRAAQPAPGPDGPPAQG